LFHYLENKEREDLQVSLVLKVHLVLLENLEGMD